ncbi:hypothetical protein [Vulcanisaeta distributa]|uniref:hypothetical protein n=1 Tax=Vulcanisaeta distributa TaxID=164451 RepID=UPI0006D22310|nr:hypothetical protein [Vulcanisaeta distributa]
MGGVIERLEGLGFRKNDERHIINYVAKASRAVELTRRWLDDALIKALVEDLSSLPDAEKLRRLITLANTKIKPKVRSSIEVVGIKMNVHVNNNGTVELRVKRKDYGDARRFGKR